MKRLARHLFTLCAAASLLLCVAACVLWVRSYWRSDALVYLGPTGHRAVQSMRGRLLVGGDNVGQAERSIRFDSWEVDADFAWPVQRGPLTWWGRIGVGYEAMATPAPALPPGSPAGLGTTTPPVIRSWQAHLPLWVICLLSGAGPLYGFTRAANRRRRLRRSLCANCGYDLRASPGRCPECGTAAAASGDSAG